MTHNFKHMMLSALLCMFTLSAVPMASAAETKMLYPQEQALKGVSNKVSTLIKKFKVYQSLHMEKTYTKAPEPGLGIAKDLAAVTAEFKKNKFPADNEKVKNLKTWIDSLNENLPILEKYYTEGYAAAQIEVKKSSIENFPEYDQDVERLKQMYKDYKNPKSAFASAEKAKEIVPRFNDEYAFYQGLPKKYEKLIQAKKASKLETWLKTNKSYLEKFEEYRDEYATQLPTLFETELSGAVTMAEKAKVDNKPAFFKGGVKQKLDGAADYLSVFESIKGADSTRVVAMVKQFNTKKAAIDAIENTMAAELLASVKTPKDDYKEADKSSLYGMVKKAWKKAYPEDEVLGIRFHDSHWKRSTNWKWNSTSWYKVDTSVLAVSVIVKTTPTVATIFPAFINKDHLEGDAMNVGVHTKSHGYVTQKMLVKNLKL